METATSSSLDVFVEISLTAKSKPTKAQATLIISAGQQEVCSALSKLLGYDVRACCNLSGQTIQSLQDSRLGKHVTT